MKKTNKTSKGLTVRTRFMLFVTGLLLVVVSAMGMTMYQVEAQELTKNADFQLQFEAQSVAKQLSTFLQTTDSSQFEVNTTFLLSGERKRFVPLGWHLQVGLFADGVPALQNKNGLMKVDPVLLKQMQAKRDGIMYASEGGQEMTFAYQFIPERSLLLVVAVSNAEIVAPLAHVRDVTFLVVVAALLVGIAGITLFARQIVRPLLAIQAQMKAVAHGQLTEKVQPKHRVREIMDVGASVNEMTEQLRRLIFQVQAATEEVALSSEYLIESAEQATHGIQQVTATVQEVASGASDQAAETHAVALDLRTMMLDLHEVVQSSQAAVDLSQSAELQAENGNVAVQQAVLQMQSIDSMTGRLAEEIEKLAGRSQEVGQIVEVITNIAAQTHLLALNAAIEAARAGEEGKGFAVVAQEVRKLAEQTEASSGQISMLIQEIQSDTSSAVQAMQEGRLEVGKGMVQIAEAGDAFAHILQASEAVALRLQVISKESSQMSQKAERVVHTVEGINKSSQEAAAQSQFCAASSAEQLSAWEQVGQSVDKLGRMAHALQEAIGRFEL